jgi:hypothetical protein
VKFLLKSLTAFCAAFFLIVGYFFLTTLISTDFFTTSGACWPSIVAGTIELVFFLGCSSLINFLIRKDTLRVSIARTFKPSVFKTHLLIYIAVFVVAFLLLNHRKKNEDNPVQVTFSGAEKIYDSTVSYRYPLNSARHGVTLWKGDTIVNAFYHFDKFGRRKMPEHRNPSATVLFFGCSYTYGDGVNDNETLPYQFYLLDTTRNVYNYAIDGWGPQQTLLTLLTKNIRKEVTNADTVVGIYIFIEDQIRRVICDKHHFNSWTKDFPCFEIEKDSLVFKGSFRKANPVKGFFYQLIQQTKVLDGFEIPLRLSPKDYQTTTEIIKQSSAAFSRQFKNGKFYVIIYPMQDTTIVPYMRAANLSVINLSQLFQEPVQMLIPGQGHPIPKAYKIIATAIFSKIAKEQQ